MSASSTLIMMYPSAGARWAVRIVGALGFLLTMHILIVAFVLPTSDADSQRPWPLSLQFSSTSSPDDFTGKDSKEGDPVDGIHNFGSADPPQEETVPPSGSPWYAPRATHLNNLTTALASSEHGVYGFLFNNSVTPAGQYGTYNWCNMPHVRKAEYKVPPASANRRLVYVELLHRHHKRTPYAANAFPVEPYRWDCGDARVHVYGEPLSSEGDSTTAHHPGSAYYEPAFETANNPFLAAAPGWHGSCLFPQLTAGGLDDAWTHGADLYLVYHDLLRFLPDMTDAAAWHKHVAFRVTNNPITSHTATMVLGGMAAAAQGSQNDGTVAETPLLVEPPGFDSLEPQYACPAAADLSRAITGTSAADSTAWADHLAKLGPLFARLDAASGVDAADTPRSSGFHVSVDHYYDNLSARQCHGKLPVAGISQDMADTIFRVGQWEYSRMYRDDARSLAASTGAWGVWMAQLAGNLRAAEKQESSVRYRHNVAHDGSISRLLSILQTDEMVWPGMGSEVVFELWAEGEGEGRAPRYLVRVLFSGRVLTSSHPGLGVLDMVPLDALLRYIDGLVGPGASLLQAKCNGTMPL